MTFIILLFIELNQEAEQGKIIGLLNSIYKEQIQNRILYNRLLSKVDSIEKTVNKIGSLNNITNATFNFDDNFMLNWPMNNEQMFLNVENCLLDDSFISLVVCRLLIII